MVDREVREPSAAERRMQERQPWLSREPQYRCLPSGRLFVRLDRYLGSRLRKQWADGRRQRLEDCPGAVVAQLEVLAANKLKADRKEREEAERRRHAWERERTEKLRLIQEEEHRIKALHGEVDAWHRSQRIRAFLGTVRANAIARHGEIRAGGELDQWLTWASEQADRIDPL